MAEMTDFEFLQSVMKELCCAAAMGAAYESWDDDFARKEVREVWADGERSMRRVRARKVAVADLKSFTNEQLFALGFGRWDDKLRLIPLWAWNYIPDGESLTSISGEIIVKGSQHDDLDVRFGCVAYGFNVP